VSLGLLVACHQRERQRSKQRERGGVAEIHAGQLADWRATDKRRTVVGGFEIQTGTKPHLRYG